MRLETDWDFFAQGLGWVAEVLDAPALSQAKLSGYWRILNRLGRDEFTWALSEHLEHEKAGRFFPKPAEILALASNRYSRLNPRVMRDKERSAASEREDVEQYLRRRPGQQQRNLDLLARVGPGGKHWLARLKKGPKCDLGCEACAFECVHRAAHLHLRQNLVAADVDWSLPVEGCCAGGEAK